MKTMHTDPIIDELRAVRDEHAARCGYDIEAIFRDIRAREEASVRDYVSRPARRTPASGGTDKEATFGHYMIGVFDVLGQSRKLQEQTGVQLSDDPAERQRVVANLKDTAGVVIGFRRLFRRFFETATRSTGRAESLPEPQRTEMLAAMASHVLLWGVSDAIFVAVPLMWDRHPAARVVDVFRSFLAAGSMCSWGLPRTIRSEEAWKSVPESIWSPAKSTAKPLRRRTTLSLKLRGTPGSLLDRGAWSS